MSLPQIITLNLFQHHFAQINGVVIYYTLERIFNSMHGTRALTNKKKQKWANQEWKQNNYNCKDPYQYGLPCCYMLI